MKRKEFSDDKVDLDKQNIVLIICLSRSTFRNSNVFSSVKINVSEMAGGKCDVNYCKIIVSFCCKCVVRRLSSSSV